MAWFTGGLFDDDSALPLNRDGVETALKAVVLDWSEIDLSILGRLLAELESEKAMIAAALEPAEAARMRQRRQLADGLLRAFHEGCGGSRGSTRPVAWQLPYPALHALNDIEHRLQLETEAMGLQRVSPPAPLSGEHCLMGDRVRMRPIG